MSNELHNMSVIQAYTMNSSKSSHDFILRVILFLLMIVAGENVMGQGYTVIYPDGSDCVNPGGTVKILFDRNVDDLEFNDMKLNNCDHFHWQGLILSGGDKSACANGNVLNLSKVSDNTVSVTIPTTSSLVYKIYYGTRGHSEYNFLWFKCTSNSYNFLGEVNINICTTNPVIRSGGCFCPNSEYSFTVENFYGVSVSSFQLSYINSSNKRANAEPQTSDFDPMTGKGTFTWTIPTNVNNTLEFTLKSGTSSASSTINMCVPEIKYVPGCAVKSQSIKYTIANACPNITYVIDNKEFTGQTIYDVTSTFNPSSNNFQKFELKQKNTNTVVASFTVPQCEINAGLSEWIPETVNTTNGCYLTINDLKQYMQIWASGDSGNDRVLKYQYSEIIDDQTTQFKDVLSDTKFEVEKKYKIRALIYIDNAFIKYEDTKTFLVKSNYKVIANGSNGLVSVTQNGVDKNGKTIACGSEVVLEATPQECFRFINWSDGNTENPRTIIVDKEYRLQANFEQIKPTVTAVSNDNNFGTVSIKNQWNGDFTSGNQVNNCGDRLIITATPKNSCYELEKWSDETTDLVKTIDVRTDVNLTAIFRQKDVHITASSNDESLGTVAISGTNSCGNTVTITATPKACSDFVQWNDGNTNKERTVEVTENQNFVATFTNASNFTLTCKDYSFLREDAGSGNATVTFPLPEVSAGTVDSYSWSVSNGLNVSGSNVTGTLSFGENSVTITATKCGHSESCTTTVKLLKSVPPCEK